MICLLPRSLKFFSTVSPFSACHRMLAISVKGPRFEPRFGLSPNAAFLSTQQQMCTWLKLGSKGCGEAIWPGTPHECWHTTNQQFIFRN